MSTRNDNRRYERPLRHMSEQQPTRQRATDQEIQKWISRQHGFVPESAWLLLCKEQFGLVAAGTAPKENPCSAEGCANSFRLWRAPHLEAFSSIFNATPKCLFNWLWRTVVRLRHPTAVAWVRRRRQFGYLGSMNAPTGRYAPQETTCVKINNSGCFTDRRTGRTV
jgi:hypothetical protein